MSSFDTLIEAVRAAMPAALWSRGLTLFRDGAVSLEDEFDEQINLRVLVKGQAVAPTVTLYPDDPAWNCDCPSPSEACEHVAAAALALREARQSGIKVATLRDVAAHVRYALSLGRTGLQFERYAVDELREERIESSLQAIAGRRAAGPSVLAKPVDLEIERMLGSMRIGDIPRGILPRLLGLLARCDDVRFEGRPIKTTTQRMAPVARLADQGGGFRLTLETDPRVTRRLGFGLVLCDSVLALESDAPLTGREIDELTRGRFIPPDHIGRALSEVLPALARRIRVVIATTRLPRSVTIPPRLLIETERDGTRLVLVPRLVYGEPPLARVEQGVLVLIGDHVPVRDLPAEDRLWRSAAVDFGVDEAGLRRGRLELELSTALEVAERLRQWPQRVLGEAAKEFVMAPALEPSVVLDPTQFGASFASGGRRDAVEADAVFEAWRNGESMVPLSSGGFAPLPLDWLSRFGPLLRDLLAARRDDGELPRAALIDLATLAEELEQPIPALARELRAALSREIDPAELALPPDLQVELRPYQRAGVVWLMERRARLVGALLADDMGLGKTVQTIAALEGRTLVVCPASVIFNWADELARFRPGLSVQRYHGPKRRLDPAANVTITSYALLRADAEILAHQNWQIVVLDEAQAIKSPESQVARAAFGLAANWRVALSGTPVENRLSELWSLSRFLNPTLLGARDAFERDVAGPAAAGDAAAIARLRQRVAPFVLRRLKRDVAPELPPRIEVTQHCELDSDERELYDALALTTRREVLAQLEAGGSTIEALEALLRLRQAACHRALLPGQTAEGSAKLDALLDALETATAEGHKSLVFSQWTKFLDLIEPHLERAGLGFTRLDGETKDRGAVVQAFQSEVGPPVMLISLRAGGVGINLTAADHVFLMDPWWNPAVEDQAADRAHRIGQDKPVIVTRFVAAETVEERLLELQSRKRSLAEAAIGETAPGGALTRADLMGLLA